MKVLGIMGSPRRKGNTEILLDRALAGAETSGAQVEKVIVSKLRISPCREIYACLKDGNCSIQDDMQELYAKLLETNHVIFAAPIFFYGIPSEAKALVDRCQALWVKRHILKIVQDKVNVRKGVFISVGATRGEKLFDGSILTVRYFFEAIGVKYAHELLVRGIDYRGEIEQHSAVLQDAFDLGQKLVSEDC